MIITNATDRIVYHTDIKQIAAKLSEIETPPHRILITSDLSMQGWKLQYAYMVNPSLLFFRNVAIAVIVLAIVLMIGFSLDAKFWHYETDYSLASQYGAHSVGGLQSANRSAYTR